MLTKEKIEKLQEIYWNNPQKFFDDILGVNFWQKQKDIVQSVRDNRRTSVRSGNSSGKTYCVAGLALWFLTCLKDSLVVNTAPTHRQVENQFWRYLRRMHRTAKQPIGGKLLKTRLDVSDNWFAIGFSPRQSEGGMEAFQGWHGQSILVIIDEASGVHPSVYEAVEGALAGGVFVRLLLIGNITRRTGDFANSFKDPNYTKIKISAMDTPNVQAGKILIPGLVTSEWVQEMKQKYGEDSDIYRVRVLAEPPIKDDDTMIPLFFVEEAIGADRELFGEEELIGLDVARYGSARSAFVYRKGNYAKILETIEKSDLMTLSGKAVNWLRTHKLANLRVDTIGLGAGVYDRLLEISDVANRVQGVNVAAEATDSEHFANLRAEAWHDTKEWLEDAVLEPSEDWYQLAAPRYKFNSRGAQVLESKEDMSKRGIRSPDIADALVLTLARPTEGGTLLPVFI